MMALITKIQRGNGGVYAPESSQGNTNDPSGNSGVQFPTHQLYRELGSGENQHPASLAILGA